MIYLLLERGEGREKEREGNINVWLPLACPLLGTWPTAQACALTEHRTGDPLILRRVLNPLTHSSQGEYLTVLFLISVVARKFKYFFIYLLTIHISHIWVVHYGHIHYWYFYTIPLFYSRLAKILLYVQLEFANSLLCLWIWTLACVHALTRAIAVGSFRCRHSLPFCHPSVTSAALFIEQMSLLFTRSTPSFFHLYSMVFYFVLLFCRE